MSVYRKATNFISEIYNEVQDEMIIHKIIISLIAFVLFHNTLAFAETIRFAPIPYQSKETLIGSYLPLVDYLKRKTGLNIELVYIQDYQRLLDDLKNSKIDMITTGSLPYLEIKREFNHAQAIVLFREQDGSTHFRCVLVTSAKGPKKITDIKGPIALTQRHSTCGYFSANILLTKAGKDIKKLGYTHLNTHNDVIESVIRGDYEVGLLMKNIAEKYKGFAVRILDQSPNWPTFSIVVNTKTLSPNTINNIKDALINLNPNDEKSLVSGKYGFTEAKEKDFDIVRRYEKYK